MYFGYQCWEESTVLATLFLSALSDSRINLGLVPLGGGSQRLGDGKYRVNFSNIFSSLLMTTVHLKNKKYCPKRELRFHYLNQRHFALILHVFLVCFSRVGPRKFKTYFFNFFVSC